MSKQDIMATVKQFSDELRYRLLKSHHKPESFPTAFQDGCNRSFKSEYLYQRPWLVFSETLGGAYCIPCVLFADSQKRLQAEALVNKPFSRYARFTSVIRNHVDKQYHKDAIVASKAFLNSLKQPESGNIAVALNKRQQETIRRNRKLLAHIIKSTLWLSRQGLAFRGHRESGSSSEGSNRGNFLELIHLLAEYNEELSEHLAKSVKTTYLSPHIQNQIISIIGKDYIRPKILEDVKVAKYYSIICDEASSAKKEYLSLVLRFVDQNQDIREEFMGFVPVTRTSGQLIGEKIIETLQHMELDISNGRGQGYDGAASVSSSRCGVQAVIKAQNPKALYFHCASHCLNLVISHSCKDVAIKTMISKINEVRIAHEFCPYVLLAVLAFAYIFAVLIVFFFMS